MQFIWTLAGGMAIALATSAAAQDVAPMPRPVAFSTVPEPDQDGLLSASELDTILGPIALYPDSLLTQIFVAATVPLDVMKADRWITGNAALPASERSQAAAAQGWDESVAVLAAGFPSVLQLLAAEIESTETLGNAVLVQTDDVLDSVQRLRAQASATGYLESNDAQTVTTDEEGEIAIAPADPEVVYVPAYDATAAFTTAPTQPTYVTTEPIYTQPGYTTGSLLTTGAIAFGTALLVDEIFDEDDDWDDYWGPGSIDWDDGQFYHRPDVDIEGDVNIDRDRVRIDGDRSDVDRDAIRDRVGERPGAVDPDRVRAGTWKPDPQKRADAQAQLSQRRQARDATGAERPPRGDAGVEARLGEGGGALAAGVGAAAGAGAARAKLQKSSAGRDFKPSAKPSFDSGLNPKQQGAPQVQRAKERGELSASKSRQPQASKPKQKVSKSGGSRKAVSKPSKKSSSVQRQSGGGSKARASSNRGKSSSARRSGGGGGGRRR